MRHLATPSLRRCVGDPERFFAEYWDRRAHLHTGGDLGGLLSIEDVDHLVASAALRYPSFRLVRDGATLPRASYTRSATIGGRAVDDLIDVGRVQRHFADGATIVLQGLHRYWPPVRTLCSELERALTHPVQANAYVTPPVASGLDVHHDTHDVFAAQTYGSKRWVVYEPVIEAPLRTQRWSSEEHDPGVPELDVVLEPGDCLYLPRGTPHAAATVDSASIHLAIGVRQLTWHDLLREAIDAAGDEVGFRASLPAGFADDPAALAPTVAAQLKELAAWIEERADPRGLVEALAERFWRSRQPLLEGVLAEILRVGEIGDDTRVRPRVGVDARLTLDGERALIELSDRTISLPAGLHPLLEALLADERRVSDLTDLDATSRLVLVRRLVREGVLEVDGE